MGFLDKVFGKRTQTPTPAAPSDNRPAARARRLTLNADLAEFDGTLATLLTKQTAARVEHLRASHLALFREQLATPAPELPAAAVVGADLGSLVNSLTQWDDLVIAEMHEVVAKSRTDWEGDVLALFFESAANATNYDALILEEVMRAATATFDDALGLAVGACPALTKDEIGALRDQWTVPHAHMQARWEAMHEERFSAVYESWADHRHTESLATAFTAMCRAHFRTAGGNAVRLYRDTLLPVVTAQLAARGVDTMSDVDAETVARAIIYLTHPRRRARF